MLGAAGRATRDRRCRARSRHGDDGGRFPDQHRQPDHGHHGLRHPGHGRHQRCLHLDADRCAVGPDPARPSRRGERAGLPVEAMGASSERLLPKLMGSMAVFAEKIPAVMLVIALGLGGLGAFGLTHLSTEFSFTDFLPEGAPLLETFDVLVDEFGGGLGETTNVLIEGDVATPDVHNGMVQSWSNMSDTDMVLSFGPRAAAESPVSALARW